MYRTKGPQAGISAGKTMIVRTSTDPFVSDGIFEAINAPGELFGVERLKEHLHALRGQRSAGTVDALCSAVRDWQGPDDPLDDQTIVVVQRTV